MSKLAFLFQVAVVSPNIPAIYESHFGIPMAGGVLNTVNTRLDAHSIARILTHGEAKVVMVEATLALVVRNALQQVHEFDVRCPKNPNVCYDTQISHYFYWRIQKVFNTGLLM